MSVIAIGKYEKIVVYVNKSNGKMELHTFFNGKTLKVTLEYHEVNELVKFLRTRKADKLTRLGDVPINAILLKRICKQYLAYVGGMITLENMKPNKYSKQSFAEIEDELAGITKEPLGSEPTFEELMNKEPDEYVPGLKENWENVINNDGAGLNALLMKELQLKIDVSEVVKKKRGKRQINRNDVVEIDSIDDIFSNLEKQLNKNETDEKLTTDDIFTNIKQQINEPNKDEDEEDEPKSGLALFGK